MGLCKIFQVDAFTKEAFQGNPAAVCILDKQAKDDWMQKVAREMNLSETAFLYKVDDGFNLRWFTPAVEVDLCGHATLASAHVLWEFKYLEVEQVARFYSKSGLLSATMREDWIELDFPAEPEAETVPDSRLVEALGVKAKYIGKNRFDYIVEVESADELINLKPDFVLLNEVPARGIIVTSVSDSGDFDFVSRFFGPTVGVYEDPVTGSAHCCLGPYWSSRLGKSQLTAYQSSPRGGVLKIRVDRNRVFISGQAVTVFHGDLKA